MAGIVEVPWAMDPTRNQPPVALRIVRPYPDEQALLAAESNAFTRTGVVLLGAPSKPSGVVLRFEMCLSDGTPVMRGEGRVVGFRPAGANEESALMLRFTRLDVKSKELLDRAVALREERRSLAPPAAAPPRAPSVAPSVPPREPSMPAPRAASVAPPPPPPSAPPPTDREAIPVSVEAVSVEEVPPSVEEVPASVPAVAPVAMVEPTPAPIGDVEGAMDVDDLDLKSADESDLTEQAPPVMMRELMLPAEAAKEKAPLPGPSPKGVPVPHREPPGQPTPPRYAPEHMPAQRIAPEHVPPPQRSPEPKVRADVVARVLERRSGEFRTTLEPEQRDSALDRLRERKSQPR
jgi:hypothetical protein